jgi:hypothetical protein
VEPRPSAVTAGLGGGTTGVVGPTDLSAQSAIHDTPVSLAVGGGGCATRNPAVPLRMLVLQYQRWWGSKLSSRLQIMHTV